MRLALDTNVLAYAEGVNGGAMKKKALALVEKLPRDRVLVPVQVFGELFHLLVRKAGRTHGDARRAILTWLDAFPAIETSVAVFLGAADLSAGHQLSIWDSVILSAAAESGCRLLLSEDLQDGFTWKGVTVINPFSGRKNDLLAALLDEPVGP